LDDLDAGIWSGAAGAGTSGKLESDLNEMFVGRNGRREGRQGKFWEKHIYVI